MGIYFTVSLYSSCDRVVFLKHYFQGVTFMKTLHTIGPRFGLEYAPTSFLVRLGSREIFVCRDFRKRYYALNPILDCSTGIEPGHIELVLFRKWLIILSKAR
jgi:hypothetical protein